MAGKEIRAMVLLNLRPVAEVHTLGKFGLAPVLMSNVPGPHEKLRFCGATLEQALFWVPQSGTVGLGCRS